MRRSEEFVDDTQRSDAVLPAKEMELHSFMH